METLKKFLSKNELIENEAKEIEVFQFSTGFSNLTYLLKSGGIELVLRRPPFGAIKRGHDMGREFKVLSSLHKAFRKIPTAYVYSEDESIIGSPFYLMERVHGIILTYGEAKKRNLPASDFKLIASQWLDTLIELHSVDYDDIGLSDLGRPEGYVSRQVYNWGKQYIKAATTEIPEAMKIVKWMEENQPKEYDHCLIHNDFKYDNIVFKDESWSEVTAVLDWEMCTLGDPLMDLGTSIAYWTMKSDGPVMMEGIPSPTVFDGNPGRNEIVNMYAKISGRDIRHLVFYYVYGLFKIAVIAQQIFYRYSKGLTKNEKFADLDKAAYFLCLLAWQAIQKNKIENLY
ncbi:MAG: phosphotransferase family protein [Melioribacteraceae bacterium]|nr:phosphotransferase family protein [Melioribacteraceae bacterium]